MPKEINEKIKYLPKKRMPTSADAELALEDAIARWTPAWSQAPESVSLSSILRFVWNEGKHRTLTRDKSTTLCDEHEFRMTATVRSGSSHIDYYMTIKPVAHLPKPFTNPLRSKPDVESYCQVLESHKVPIIAQSLSCGEALFRMPPCPIRSHARTKSH